MASLTNTSGGKTPVDSTETRDQRKHFSSGRSYLFLRAGFLFGCPKRTTASLTDIMVPDTGEPHGLLQLLIPEDFPAEGIQPSIGNSGHLFTYEKQCCTLPLRKRAFILCHLQRKFIWVLITTIHEIAYLGLPAPQSHQVRSIASIPQQPPLPQVQAG